MHIKASFKKGDHFLISLLDNLLDIFSLLQGREYHSSLAPSTDGSLRHDSFIPGNPGAIKTVGVSKNQLKLSNLSFRWAILKRSLLWATASMFSPCFSNLLAIFHLYWQEVNLHESIKHQFNCIPAYSPNVKLTSG